jgi:sterol desaturase/sphingolipid hydroxylase (fatty acid hydroxylase superfamily)
LLGYLFPRRVWLNPSALLDYRFIAVDRTLIAAVLAGAATLGLIEKGEDLARDLTWSEPAAPGVLVAYTVVLLVTEDFFRYWMHRWMHVVPWLWQFHKVHHSSIVLTPFSLYRSHPVNSLLNAARSGAAAVLVTWAFASAFPGDLSVLSILGVNAGRFLFNLLGGNLRHSHVWISFGRRLSHVFISPAMHQIHHSARPLHWGRNFGSQLAIWDWMFGTLFVPPRRERLRIGLGPGASRGYRSVIDLYLAPFRGRG